MSAGKSPSCASPVEPAAPEHAAAVAEQLLQQVLEAQEAEAAAAEADAAAQRAAAQQLEAEVGGLERAGRWVEAAAAAVEADRWDSHLPSREGGLRLAQPLCSRVLLAKWGRRALSL